MCHPLSLKTKNKTICQKKPSEKCNRAQNSSPQLHTIYMEGEERSKSEKMQLYLEERNHQMFLKNPTFNSHLSRSTYLHHDDGGRYLPAGVEVESDVLVGPHLLREPARHHLGQGLLLGLGLAGKLGGAVAEAGDVVLAFLEKGKAV